MCNHICQRQCSHPVRDELCIEVVNAKALLTVKLPSCPTSFLLREEELRKVLRFRVVHMVRSKTSKEPFAYLWDYF